MNRPSGEAAERLDRLHARLLAASGILPTPPHLSGEVADDVGTLLDALVTEALRTRHSAEAWLLLVAASGHLPDADEVIDLIAQLELCTGPAEVATWVLRRAAETIAANGEIDRELVLVSDTVLIDVDHAARRNRHTGIQRVTREVCTRWDAAHDITLVVWDEGETTLRALAGHEEERVLRWSGPYESTAADLAESARMPVVVPWRCTVVLPEVAQGVTARPLAALAQLSGSTVVAVGYDAIPVTSADLRPPGEPNMYVRYLTVLKHTRRIAGISTSATAEFRGFADAVRAQGLAGPDVTEVMLAAEVPATAGPTARPERPQVVCVGSHETHKNHLALLHAAELCWRDGLDFELSFIGGPGWASPVFDPTLAQLARRGRPVHARGNVSDEELWDAYRTAAFTVFPSVHEGFGLPVAESLACGTPAITTDYGSTGEIAERGGCLQVDPRDDAALRDAMRTLLTEPAVLDRLRAEASAAPVRTWQAYADELWQTLVEAGAR